MSRIIQTIFFTGLAIVVVSLPVSAGTPDQDRIEQLEKENDALRQEIAQLRLDLSQLKRVLKQHEAGQNDPAEEGTSPSDEPAAEPNDKGKPRTFRSADEIYRSIPQNMRPARDGWDIEERRTVSEWLKTNITGKRFEARKEISDVKLRYDTIKRIWEVSIYFKDEEMRYMSWDMKEQLNHIILRGDKTFSENTRKQYKVGGTVQVTGTISVIAWDSFIIQRAENDWHPTKCTL